MNDVCIVTDSSASFSDPHLPEDFGVEIIPLTIHFGDETFKDGVDITRGEVLQRMQADEAAPLPRVTAPSIEAFEALYGRISQRTNQICVVVNSQHFTETYANAQSARSKYRGRCDIMVIDSMTTSANLGFLASEIAMSAHHGTPLDDIVREARALIPRLYCVFYVDSLRAIQQHGLIAETQAIMGTMLEIKPLVTIEDGQLITMEKVRTHPQAIDRMMEFVTEFLDMQQLVIMQNTTRITDKTRMLQDRLALEFAETNYPVLLYEPLIASLIGPDAMGMALLEGEF